MKIKTKLVTSVLAGAMLALPVLSAPSFAEPSNSVNPNYVQRVDWWHHNYDDGYAYRNRATTEMATTEIATMACYSVRLRLWLSRSWRLRKCFTAPGAGMER